jgi:hypothetical protein
MSKMSFKIVLFTIMSISQAAIAGIEIIQDGKVYRCEERGPGNPGGTVDCANRAYSGPYNKEESVRLCQGARNDGPALCGIKAYNGAFNKAQSIDLCIGSRNEAPADCAQLAYSGPFSASESVQLCSRGGTTQRAECAVKAYNGPYSKAEAIELCSSGRERLVMRSLKLMEDSSDLKAPIKNIKIQLNKLELPKELSN